MKFLDDLLCLIGMLCIVCAAFGVDWRLGMVMLGLCFVVSGVLVGKFLRQNPGILAEAEMRRQEKRRKRSEEE